MCLTFCLNLLHRWIKGGIILDKKKPKPSLDIVAMQNNDNYGFPKAKQKGTVIKKYSKDLQILFTIITSMWTCI